MLRCPVCFSCLSVTMVYCGQTVGWIKMPLGTEVGLGQRDIVLDGDPAPPTERGIAALPLFSPCLLWPNGRPSQQLLHELLYFCIYHCDPDKHRIVLNSNVDSTHSTGDIVTLSDISDRLSCRQSRDLASKLLDDTVQCLPGSYSATSCSKSEVRCCCIADLR